MEKKVEDLLKRQVEADQKEDKDEEDIFSGPNRTGQIERLRRKAERIREFLKKNGVVFHNNFS